MSFHISKLFHTIPQIYHLLDKKAYIWPISADLQPHFQPPFSFSLDNKYSILYKILLSHTALFYYGNKKEPRDCNRSMSS